MRQRPGWRVVGRCASSDPRAPPRSQSAGSGAGYWVPRLAVGGTATIAAVALYEMLDRAVAPSEESMEGKMPVCADWDEEWSTFLDARAAGDSNYAVAMAAGERLRTTTHSRGRRRHVIFVRHAQPAEEVLTGGGRASSSSLSTVGRQQAELTATRLANLFPEICAVYHAPSPAARATAAALRHHLPKEISLIESALLEEGVPIVPSPSPPSLTSVPDEEVMQDTVRAEAAFRTHVWPPSGEDQSVSSAEVVIGHGNFIRYFVCRALQLHPVIWSRLAAHHGAITWLDIDCSGAVALREFGGIGHLPKELVTYQ